MKKDKNENMLAVASVIMLLCFFSIDLHKTARGTSFILSLLMAFQTAFHSQVGYTREDTTCAF